MTEVQTHTIIEEHFNAAVSRLFGSQCLYTPAGDLVCRFTFQYARRGGGTEHATVRIKRDQLNDPQYVTAAIQVATDQLLNKVLK